MSDNRKLRCAIYTRKSSEEGLDQAFNSLDAQREACAAYIASQASLGWRMVAEHYDDGGISGGTLERPSIQRLLQHIKDGKIDVVVVYKIDRLTRSLTDFAKLVEVFDGHAVSFVSVTQQFNTTTSMGRLTLNVLLSFAQFEREVTAERIRDKIAASKQKGMFMGGRISLGYRLEHRKMLVDAVAADHVRYLFDRYLELGSVSDLVREINARAITRSGKDVQAAALPDLKPMSRGRLRHVLANPIYIGKLRHRDKIFDGEHQGIVAPDIFQKVQALLTDKAPKGRSPTNIVDVHPLVGLVFDETGDRLAPNHAHNHGKRYRYYISSRLRDSGRAEKGGWRIPAGELEPIVLQQAQEVLQDGAKLSEWLVQHIPTGEIERGLAAASDMAQALKQGESASAQKQILQTLFERITLSPNGIRFAVRSRALVRHLLSAIGAPDIAGDGSASESADADVDAELIMVDRPMVIKRRGVESRIVINGAAGREPDPALVDLVARAHHYLHRLTDGSVSSIADLANELSVHRADISRILPLAYLSPAITEAILTGRQPADLTVKTLSRLIDIPPAWADQAQAIGM